MAAQHPDEYWKAVALGIEAENQKATVYISTHNASLGVAREEIFRRVLANETTAQYKVKTGLIRGRPLRLAPEQDEPFQISKQCDLLVYDAHKEPPLYKIGGFVVVPSTAARFVVEVKSDLDECEFRRAIDVWKSIRPFRVPTGCFSYDGVTFPTFLKYLGQAIENDVLNLPDCFAVHSRNYFAFRCYNLQERNQAGRYLAVDMGGVEGMIGAATSFFLMLYDRWLQNDGLFDLNIPYLFGTIAGPGIVKAQVYPDGWVISSIPE